MIVVAPEQQTPARVSHNPAIAKFGILGNGRIPGLTGLSRAFFPPGETANAHLHPDMTEIFHVLSGQGSMSVDGQKILLTPGMSIAVEPGETHEITATAETGLELLYFGICT